MSHRHVIGVVAIAVLTVGIVDGCGVQNEYLAEGKDSLKSEKRNRITAAVEQFRVALKSSLSPKEEAETRYLLAYYDESLPLNDRVEHFVKACQLEPRKYEETLLYETLRDRDETVRNAVRLALAARFKENPARIRRELVKALNGKDNRDRYDAAWVVGYLAATDDALLDAIERALDHRRMETRLNAVIAVQELAQQNPQRAQQTIPALRNKIEAIPRRHWWKFWDREGERESPEVRQLAVAALGSMGAKDELLKVLSNKGSSLRTNAMDALIRAGGGEGSVDVLLGLLSDDTGDAIPWQTPRSVGHRTVRLK
jgi:HEAT repeat protein